MKYRLFIILSFFVLLYPSCEASPKNKQTKMDSKMCLLSPDSTIISHLGNSLSDILFNPKKVNCYSVENVDSVASGQLEPYYKRGDLIKKLTKEEISIMQFTLLSNQKNYVKDTLVVSSPYVPRLDFEFVGKKGEKANLIVSLSDFSWSILFDGKKQFNFNNHSQDFSRFCRFLVNMDREKQCDKKEPNSSDKSK